MRFPAGLFVLVLALAPMSVSAQQLAFGGIRADTTQPVEVTADSLAVNQETGTATFTGNVLVGQGSMRLQAESVLVEYVDGDQSRIDRLHASGGVTLASETEAAEAREAVYDVVNGNIVLTGDVLLTQGANVMSGQRLSVDLRTGAGQMDGRVRTILQPGGQ